MEVLSFLAGPVTTTNLLSMIVCVLMAVFIISLLVWAWGLCLDRNEHDPCRIRAFMLIGLGALTAIEMSLVSNGICSSSVGWIAIFANCWGGLDATLRFPAAHDFESMFAAKQFCLLVLKSLVYALGGVTFRGSVGILCMVMIMAIWSLPIMFLMAMPMDPREQVPTDDHYDVDLVIRVWQLVTSSRERRECVSTCRTWWSRKLVAASESSSLAKMALCATSPHYRRTFKRTGRSV